MKTSLRTVEIFVRVVQSGSFAAAARSLLIDPASVSRAIKGLEEDLGILLFTRSTRVLKLTTEGARFYRDGERMLQSFAETINRFQANTQRHRHLRVGMGPALGRRMLMRALPSFQAQYPGIQLTLFSINDRTEIGDDGIEVLIRPRGTRQRGGAHKEPQGLVVRKLVQSPVMLCASPAYLTRAGVPRTPADLPRHACLALLTLERDVHDEWQFTRTAERKRVKFAPTVTAHGDELREAALAGCGIVRLLACHVEEEIRSGSLLRVLPDWDCLGGMPVVAIYRKTRPTLSPVSAFVEHLVLSFRQYDKAGAVPS